MGVSGSVVSPEGSQVSEVGETLCIDPVSRDFLVLRESQSRDTNVLSISIGIVFFKFWVSVSVSVSKKIMKLAKADFS